PRRRAQPQLRHPLWHRRRAGLVAAYFKGPMTMGSRCLIAFAILATLGGCVCPNPAAWFVSPIDPNSTLCTGCTSSADIGPPGQGPYIDWATPRVPIGAPTIEVHGGRFNSDGLVVELHSGSTVVPTQIASNDGSILIAKPAWPAAAPMAGSATVVVKNGQG